MSRYQKHHLALSRIFHSALSLHLQDSHSLSQRVELSHELSYRLHALGGMAGVW